MLIGIDIKRVIDTFHILDNWDERYDFIIELGKKLAGLPLEDQNKDTKVHACMSNVWVTACLNPENNHIQLKAESDAPIVRGLVTILVLLYTDKPLNDLIATDIEALFEQLSLSEHLSPNRHVGMYAMVEKIKTSAQACVDAHKIC